MHSKQLSVLIISVLVTCCFIVVFYLWAISVQVLNDRNDQLMTAFNQLQQNNIIR